MILNLEDSLIILVSCFKKINKMDVCNKKMNKIKEVNKVLKSAQNVSFARTRTDREAAMLLCLLLYSAEHCKAPVPSHVVG